MGLDLAQVLVLELERSGLHLRVVTRDAVLLQHRLHLRLCQGASGRVALLRVALLRLAGGDGHCQHAEGPDGDRSVGPHGYLTHSYLTPPDSF